MDQRCEKHGNTFPAYEFCIDCMREQNEIDELAGIRVVSGERQHTGAAPTFTRGDGTGPGRIYPAGSGPEIIPRLRDQPASSLTKFEAAAIAAMQGLIAAHPEHVSRRYETVSIAVKHATALMDELEATRAKEAEGA